MSLYRPHVRILGTGSNRTRHGSGGHSTRERPFTGSVVDVDLSPGEGPAVSRPPGRVVPETGQDVPSVVVKGPWRTSTCPSTTRLSGGAGDGGRGQGTGDGGRGPGTDDRGRGPGTDDRGRGPGTGVRDRRRGTGDGDRRQGTGDRRQGTGDRRQGTGDRGQVTGDGGQATGDRGRG